jgi:hypothetical protein
MTAIELPYGYLTISKFNLRELNHLSSDLSYLSCSHCELTKIPPLPPKIYKLWCHSNLLTQLPQIPPSLRIFTIYNNPIIHLPLLHQLTWIGISPHQALPNFHNFDLKAKIVIFN